MEFKHQSGVARGRGQGRLSLGFSKFKIRFLKLLCAFGSCFAFAWAKTEGATRFLGLLPILLTNLLLKINLFY